MPAILVQVLLWASAHHTAHSTWQRCWRTSGRHAPARKKRKKRAALAACSSNHRLTALLCSCTPTGAQQPCRSPLASATAVSGQVHAGAEVKLEGQWPAARQPSNRRWRLQQTGQLAIARGR